MISNTWIVKACTEFFVTHKETLVITLIVNVVILLVIVLVSYFYLKPKNEKEREGK